MAEELGYLATIGSVTLVILAVIYLVIYFMGLLMDREEDE